MRIPVLVLALVTAAGGVSSVAPIAAAQTAVSKQFTYQGYLEDAGVPFNGQADIFIGLYNQSAGGTLRDSQTFIGVQVTKGVFSVVVNFGETDQFGAQIYDGRELYLQVSVDLPSGPPVILSPRQLVQPAPIALSMPNVTPKGLNVGIGTADPAVKLHVKDASTNLFYMEGSNANGSFMNLANSTAGGTNWSVISTGSANGEGAGKLLFKASTVNLTLDPAGNVGVGTVNPASRLHVVGNTSLVGNVGIGTTTPVARFHVSDSASLTAVFQSSSGNGASMQLLNTSAGGRSWALLSTGTTNSEGSGKLLIADQTSGGARLTINASGNVGIGTISPTEKLHVNGNVRAKVIIIEGGADLAESYDVAAVGGARPVPGMVVAIDPDKLGKLRISNAAYDTTVAGIISGADGVSPGLVLGQKGTVADGEHPVANAGRVWCYVDADANGPVLPGDLLTTSSTPGHAMKASDRARAGGATLGKAMSRLEKGKGLVLVLVTLQ